MDAKQIYRGYIHQLMYGCDAVNCNNEYCRSCPNFKFAETTDLKQVSQIAKSLLKEHSTKSKFCKYLARYHYDPQFFTEFKFPKIDEFKNVKNLNQNQISTILKDTSHFPYLFLDIPNDISKINENPFYFNDDNLQTIFNSSKQNPEFFKNWPEILLTYLSKIENFFCSTKPQTITYRILRCIYLFLFGISLFETNDYSPFLEKVILIIFERDRTKTISNFLLKAYSQTPKVSKIVLEYLQDNITFAAILADEFMNKLMDGNGKIPKFYDDALQPKFLHLASFIELLRKANPNMPTISFVNEVFTRNFVTSFEYSDLVDFLANKTCYLDFPSILTLSWKSEMLGSYFHLIQNTFGRRNANVDDQEEEVEFPESYFFRLAVRRDNLIQDAIMQLNSVPSTEMMKRLRVIFQGEQGVDVGGVSREFFYLVCNEVFHVKYGMFQQTPSGTYWFAPFLSCEPITYQLIGSIVALAIYNSILLPIRFPSLLYKKLWNVPLKLEDYEEIDPDIVNSLKKLKKSKRKVDVSNMDLMFYITQDNFGAAVDIPLCEGGLEKQVTNDNLDEYIELYTNYLLVESIKIQFEKFAFGFNKVMDATASEKYRSMKIKQIIAYDEADTLVSGEEIIHWDLLKTHCEYTDGYSKDSPAVQFFWEIFDEMTTIEKKQFLRFFTGCDRLPVSGPQEHQMTIQKVNNINQLPVSHTCFNIFSLPDYPTKEEMRRKILISISHTEGFGLI